MIVSCSVPARADCLPDLKPENLLFRTKAEDADVMVADFGLSRIMPEDKLQLLTEICGTPGVCYSFRDGNSSTDLAIVYGSGNLQEKYAHIVTYNCEYI